MTADRLALGTAQFGLPYGVASGGHAVARDEAVTILRLARERGVDTVDTAVAYGDSERRLGEIGVAGWRVVTKLPATPGGVEASAWVRDTVQGSLSRLGIERLWGVLLHRPMELLGAAGEELHRALLDEKERGTVEGIGISVYGPEELDALVQTFSFDLVQAPFNVLDRRLMRSGWLGRLADAGIEVHTRSAFLQGLLLMPASDRPPWFDRWSGLWRRWCGWLEEVGATPLEACLGFVTSHPEVSRVVVGVDSARHLREILDGDRSLTGFPEDLASDDLDLVIPSRWALA